MDGIIKAISYFYAIGYRGEQLEKIKGHCPYELERTAYKWFDDGEAEFFVAFGDGTEEQYTL